jgi:ribonuclease BN (tRNA processing enzyme)
MALVVDAGTGFVPASADLLKEGVRRISLLMTHYHHDHTQGFPLAPHTFIKPVVLDVFGPREYGIGPREMLETIMRAPFFPVEFARVASHFSFHEMANIGSHVLAIHPETGAALLRLEEYERVMHSGPTPGLASRKELDESLIVRMHKTVHPEYTVSYRFEERPTGKVMVVLTDHENTDSLPRELSEHIAGADLLVQDAQYTRRQYDTSTAGFGHGTGDYTARVMKEARVARLGQTHHDPMSNDVDVDAIVNEAREWLVANGVPEKAENVFACADYQEIEV